MPTSEGFPRYRNAVAIQDGSNVLRTTRRDASFTTGSEGVED
jgi:hypothetical protein